MSRVYLSIGSNIDRERRIRQGLDALCAHFGALDLSPVYESNAADVDVETSLGKFGALRDAQDVGVIIEREAAPE